MGQEKAVNYEIPTHTLFGGGAPAGSVVHRERPTVPHHRAQHPQHRGRGVHRGRHQPREPYRDAHAGREDRYPQGHHRQGGIRRRHVQPDDDRQREIHQPDQDFAAAVRGVRPAGAALRHALALSGLRVDDRGRAAHRAVIHRRRADRIDTDRHTGAYGHGLCRRRHRPEGRHGLQPQTGACRHHHLLAHGRGTFRHGFRNGTSGRRHLPRPHGALDAPCPAHQREDRYPRYRPLEQHGRRNHDGYARRLRHRRSPVPSEGYRRLADDAEGRTGRKRYLYEHDRTRMDKPHQRCGHPRKTPRHDQGLLRRTDL